MIWRLSSVSSTIRIRLLMPPARAPLHSIGIVSAECRPEPSTRTRRSMVPPCISTIALARSPGRDLCHLLLGAAAVDLLEFLEDEHLVLGGAMPGPVSRTVISKCPSAAPAQNVDRARLGELDWHCLQ